MASEGMHSPVEQFEIKRFIEFSAGGYDISFTNSSLFMLLAMVVGGTFLTVAMSKREMVPGRLQGAAEMMYEFVADMVRSNVGNDGRAYFPFVFTLFVFLLFGNMLGLIPYSYTFTSQIIVTFAMAAFVFVGVTIVGLVKHGLHFFSFFVPTGAPKVLIFCQHAGRPHHAEGLCRPRRDDLRRRRDCDDRLAAAAGSADRADRAGGAGCSASGLRLYDPDLHVFE